MYAIVKTGGKQYRLAEGDQVRVEKLEAEAGSEFIFDQVMVVSKDDGETIFGTPTIPDARVVARVLEHGKADKILVFKYKSKVNYRRRYGHRQPYTEVKVEKIELGVAPTAAPKPRKTAKKEAAPEGEAEKAPAEKAEKAEKAPAEKAPAKKRAPAKPKKEAGEE